MAESLRTMSVDAFLPWAARQSGRWELVDGAPLAMSPERVIHGDTIYRVARAFDLAMSLLRNIASDDAIGAAKIPCRFVVDSAAVRIDERNSFQPDLMIYCGDPVAPETLMIPNPVVVVEVLSPGNAMRDFRDKLAGYFRVPSVAHYLIVDPEKKLVIHHARSDRDAILTRLISSGMIALDPPGLEVDIRHFFPVA